MNHVWIVEVRFEAAYGASRNWEPTVGIALTKLEAEKRKQEWVDMCPDEEFRITKYESVSSY